jgi:hypothetical protein
MQIPKRKSDRGRAAFVTGIALIVSSFLVYPAYPIIILSLRSWGSIKLGEIFIPVWLLSWGVFSAGILLVGLEGYDWLKTLWERKTSRPKK